MSNYQKKYNVYEPSTGRTITTVTEADVRREQDEAEQQQAAAEAVARRKQEQADIYEGIARLKEGNIRRRNVYAWSPDGRRRRMR